MLNDQTSPASTPFSFASSRGADAPDPDDESGVLSSAARQRIARHHDLAFRLFVLALLLAGGLILMAMLSPLRL